MWFSFCDECLSSMPSAHHIITTNMVFDAHSSKNPALGKSSWSQENGCKAAPPSLFQAPPSQQALKLYQVLPYWKKKHYSHFPTVCTANHHAEKPSWWLCTQGNMCGIFTNCNCLDTFKHLGGPFYLQVRLKYMQNKHISRENVRWFWMNCVFTCSKPWFIEAWPSTTISCICYGNKLSPNMPYYGHGIAMLITRRLILIGRALYTIKWLSMGRGVKDKAERTESTDSETWSIYITPRTTCGPLMRAKNNVFPENIHLNVLCAIRVSLGMEEDPVCV